METEEINLLNRIIEEKENDIVYKVENLNLWYGNDKALKDVNIDIRNNEVTAIIGPSGCGKSTFIKTLNRMVELIPIVKTTGEIKYKDVNIFDKSVRVEDLRTKVGMVFQKPNPFPKTVYENVVYGPRIHGIKNKKILDEIVEVSLRRAALWEEVRDRLHDNAYGLSGGQQQRLCLARVLAVEPEVVLMDEPTSALDPISTLKIEDLIHELKRSYTIIIVTHNMQQAGRISDKTAFFLNGEIIEFDRTDKIFSTPADKRTEDYITGRFG
ncbi:MAG: phosphate ABC transporter ATP-binding protein [Clostridia bacterium]|nr:phosphate ABC transporter ATP-binding protein [Clostridia bacterium]